MLRVRRDPTSWEHRILHQKDREKYSWMIDGSFRLAMWVEQPSCRADFSWFLAPCLELALAFCRDQILIGETVKPLCRDWGWALLYYDYDMGAPSPPPQSKPGFAVEMSAGQQALPPLPPTRRALPEAVGRLVRKTQRWVGVRNLGSYPLNPGKMMVESFRNWICWHWGIPSFRKAFGFYWGRKEATSKNASLWAQVGQ